MICKNIYIFLIHHKLEPEGVSFRPCATMTEIAVLLAHASAWLKYDSNMIWSFEYEYVYFWYLQAKRVFVNLHHINWNFLSDPLPNTEFVCEPRASWWRPPKRSSVECHAFAAKTVAKARKRGLKGQGIFVPRWGRLPKVIQNHIFCRTYLELCIFLDGWEGDFDWFVKKHEVIRY